MNMEQTNTTLTQEEESLNYYTKIRWVYLAVCTLCLLLIGVVYGWSVFRVPLAETFQWQASELSMTYSILMACFCLGSLTDGFLIKKVRTMILFRLGAWLITAGFLLTALLPTGCSIGLLYLCYGVLVGYGVGLVYNALLTIGSDWFPDKTGLSVGIMMLAYGMSTLILSHVMTELTEHSAISWRVVFRALGILIFAVLSLASLFLRHPFNSHHPEQDAILPRENKTARVGFEFVSRDLRTEEMLRCSGFWVFYLSGLLGAMVGSVVVGFARDISLAFGSSVELAATLVGILSLFNGFGRMLCGVSCDRLGLWKTMLLFSTLNILAPVLLLLALQRQSLVLGLAALVLTGVSYGSLAIISSIFVRTLYGKQDYTMNYGISNTKVLFSSFSATAAGAIVARTGTFRLPAIGLIVVSLLSLLLTMLIHFCIRRDKSVLERTP